MKYIDCTKNCKMTKLLRESKFCTGKAEVVDGQIVFGCKKEVLSANESERNYLTCIFIDMNMNEHCLKCPLACHKNKNEDFAKIQKQNDRIDAILKTINNFGVTSSHANKISKLHKNNKSMSEDVLSALSFSNNILNKGMKGKGYDISHFSFIMKNMIKKIKK